MTERQPRPEFQTVDIVQMLHEPEFAEQLKQINFSIAAYSNTHELESEPGAADLEQEAIDEFNNDHFGLDWIGREIHTTFTYENDDGELGVETVTGTFIGAVPRQISKNILIDHETGMYARNMGYRALSLSFADEEYDYKVPLDTDHILSCTVEVPERKIDVSQPLCVAQCGAEILAHAITTDYFLNLSLARQREQIYAAIADIERSWGAPCITNSITYSVTANYPEGLVAHKANRLRLCLPGLMERKVPYMEVEDYERGPELWVEMTMDDNDAELVRLRDILQVSVEKEADDELESEAELTRKDILALFVFDDDIKKTVDDIEYSLNYPGGEEFETLVLQAANNLYDLLPLDVFDGTMQIEGNVFYTGPDGKTKMTYGHFDHAKAISIDAIEVSGAARLALKVAIDADDPDSSNIVYVVPTEEFLSQLEVIDESGDDSDEAYYNAVVGEFKEAANDAKKLLGKPRFKNGELNQQVAMLQEITLPLDENVRNILEWAPTHSRISCTTDEYYVFGIDDAAKTYAEIAADCHVSLQSGGNEHTFQIKGDEARVSVPELSDERETHFRGVKDFPLSGGQPMLIIRNTPQQCIYLIPAAKVTSISTTPSLHIDNQTT